LFLVNVKNFDKVFKTFSRHYKTIPLESFGNDAYKILVQGKEVEEILKNDIIQLLTI